MQCAACGSDFKPRRRDQRFCQEACRKRGFRGAVVTFPESPGSVATSTSTALTDAGVLDSPAGQAAMVIARKLDAGGDTGSAVAALVRELRATVADALAEAGTVADVIDELALARERRLAGA